MKDHSQFTTSNLAITNTTSDHAITNPLLTLVSNLSATYHEEVSINWMTCARQ